MLNLLTALLLCLQGEPQFPANQGAINDFANIMSEEDKTKLRAECAQLRDSGGAAVVVVTTPSLYGLDVADYANQLFKKWGIGLKKTDSGVLILIAPNERKARIEVGYGNEGKLTDLEAKNIIDTVIKPLFRQGKVSASIVAGTEAVLAKLGGTAESAPPTTIAQPRTKMDTLDWVILGIAIPIFIWLPGLIIVLLVALYFLSKLINDDFSGGGWSSGGGGWSSWSSGGGSSDSSSSSGGGESSSCGGGDSGGGGASGDL